jgi:hypothetical protein
LALATAIVTGVLEGPVDAEQADRTPFQAAGETPVIPDPDLEDRIAQDVAAFINSERQARGLPVLATLDGEVAALSNQARLRDERADKHLLSAYGYGTTSASELYVRLGTGTRSGEAVAGWLANAQQESALLDRDATGLAVAASCDAGERGGDLVLTVHVLTQESTSPAAAPVADDRPGAGRGEACQFAELATGPTAEESLLVPSALAFAGTLALALALLDWQRRRTMGEPGYVRADTLDHIQRAEPPSRRPAPPAGTQPDGSSWG